MRKFRCLDAVAVPLPISNIDTDKILPARFLKTISREGLGSKLFWSLRQDPSFILNRNPWDEAGIIVSLDNFGCGSSREHAPWALLDFGIRCVIAPSIADIFYNNCFKNGILPIILDDATIRRLLRDASDAATAKMQVDLVDQKIRLHDGEAIDFEVDPLRRQDLLDGVDEIAKSMSYLDKIGLYEARHHAQRPWRAIIDPSELAAG